MGLTLVRHTLPLQAEGLCYGRTDLDLALSFEAEAEVLLATLAPVTCIVTSPLRRCRRLADFLGARLALPVAVDPDLREMDFGGWEGRAWEAIAHGELDAWAADFMHARPHGGESVAMLLERTRRAVRNRLTSEPHCVAITHAGVIRAALFAAGGSLAAWRHPVPFGGTVTIDPARWSEPECAVPVAGKGAGR